MTNKVAVVMMNPEKRGGEGYEITKMQGLGNDYVYVNCFQEKVENPSELAKFVSNRNFGVGADGLILIKPTPLADCEMEMYNADGSQGAMCGNGIRCVAKYVYDYGLVKKEVLTVATRSGIKTLHLTVENGKVARVKVNMGSPVLDPDKIPIAAEEKRVLQMPLEVEGKIWKITGVSMGNPHAVTFVEDVRGLDLEKIGPGLNITRLFRIGSNTEFVRVIDRHTGRDEGVGTRFRRNTGLRNRGLCGSGGLHFKWLYRRQSDSEKSWEEIWTFTGIGKKTWFI